MKKEKNPALRLADYLVWSLYKLINRFHFKNKMGTVAGWWQAGNLDRIAWEWLVKNHRPNKYWLTSEYKVKYFRRIDKIINLVYGVNNFNFAENRKGNRVANFDLEIWQGDELMTIVNFVFVEKKSLKEKK